VSQPGGIDLDAYCRRIGHGGSRAPTLETLTALHLAHPSAIAFESLDPLLGRPVLIDPASLTRKLVGQRRGGYCFEQNGLFAQVLTALGFEVTPLAARVRWMLAPDAPRTPLSHMLLKVDLTEGPFICDVGFGGQSPTAPLRLEPGLAQATPHGEYRVTERPDGYGLELRLPDRWAPMYEFTTARQAPRDYEVFNWHTSTHPDSRFVNNLIAAKVTGERRLNLFNGELTTYWPDGRSETVALEGPGAAHAALARDFGLEIELGELERVWEKLPRPPAQTA
jgi:N-hydroxyarylamine O-acetyltransferase